jgi:hypothetical protein
VGDDLALVESRECDVHLYLNCVCASLSCEGPINSRMALATHNAKYDPTLDKHVKSSFRL